MLLVGLVSLVNCRSSYPPSIPICITDGLGGMDCKSVDGTIYYLSPSESGNMWATTQDGMEKFSAWCYDIQSSKMKPRLESLRVEIQELSTMQDL